MHRKAKKLLESLVRNRNWTCVQNFAYRVISPEFSLLQIIYIWGETEHLWIYIPAYNAFCVPNTKSSGDK